MGWGKSYKMRFCRWFKCRIRRIQDGEYGSRGLIHSSAVSTFFFFSGLNVAHPKPRKIISTSQGYWVDSIRQVCKMLDTGQILSKYHFSSHPCQPEHHYHPASQETWVLASRETSSFWAGSLSFPNGRGSWLRSRSSFSSRVGISLSSLSPC